MKVLLIEDEKALADSVRTYLKQEGYLCENAKTVFEGDEKISLHQYDCVLIDLMLPDGSGMNLVNTLKQAQPQAGIIIISARNKVVRSNLLAAKKPLSLSNCQCHYLQFAASNLSAAENF